MSKSCLRTFEPKGSHEEEEKKGFTKIRIMNNSWFYSDRGIKVEINYSTDKKVLI